MIISLMTARIRERPGPCTDRPHDNPDVNGKFRLWVRHRKFATSMYRQFSRPKK